MAEDQPKTVDDAIAFTAKTLVEAKISMEVIADKFLSFGTGLLAQVRGPEYTATRLEDAAKKVRSGEAAGETRRH